RLGPARIVASETHPLAAHELAEDAAGSGQADAATLHLEEGRGEPRAVLLDAVRDHGVKAQQLPHRPQDSRESWRSPVDVLRERVLNVSDALAVRRSQGHDGKMVR